MLDDDVAGREVTVDDAGAWTTPRAIGSVEYFASPMDLCRAMIELHAHPEASRIRDVLGANPGIPLDPDAWSYVGFKGGSEPGVLSLAWYLEGASGTYVYVVNVTDDAARLPELELASLAGAGIDLLAGR
jgi:hypothetical protein